MEAPPRGRGPLLIGPQEIYGREYMAAPHGAFQRKLLIAPHELYEYNRKFLTSVAPPLPYEHEPSSQRKIPMAPHEFFGGKAPDGGALHLMEDDVSDEEEGITSDEDGDDGISDDDTFPEEEEYISEEEENHDKISGWINVSRALDLIDEDRENIENQDESPSWMRLSRLCPNLDMID